MDDKGIEAEEKLASDLSLEMFPQDNLTDEEIERLRSLLKKPEQEQDDK